MDEELATSGTMYDIVWKEIDEDIPKT